MADATLYITQGGAVSVSLSLVSDTGSSYTMPAGHSFHAFTIAPYLGASPSVLVTSATVSGSTVTVSLSSANTQTLTAGKYVGQVVFALSGGNYTYSDPFVVVVTAKPDFT